MRSVLLRYGSRLFGASIGLAVTGGSLVMAQEGDQPNTTVGTAVYIDRVGTPSEYDYALDLFIDRDLTPVSNNTLARPDSISDAMKKKLHHWVSSLGARGVTGIQLDPYGQLLIKDEADRAALDAFDAWLALPSTTLADQAMTLSGVVQALADPTSAPRMDAARRYLGKLAALPDSFGWEKYQAYAAMGTAELLRGKSESALADAKAAFRQVPWVPFSRRWGHVFGGQPFWTFVNAVSTHPDGQAQIDTLVAALLPYAKPSPADQSNDPNSVWQARANETMLKNNRRAAALIGKNAPDLIATHWLNTSVPAARDDVRPDVKRLPLSDGKVRLIEFGVVTCRSCIASLPGLRRLAKAAPEGAEVWYVTQTLGYWRGERVGAEEEIQGLREFYVDFKKVDFPIAIWKSAIDSSPLDGTKQVEENPNTEAFAVYGTPSAVIVDGNGKIRHAVAGFSPQSEAFLHELLVLLVAEAKGVDPNSIRTARPAPVDQLTRTEIKQTLDSE